MITIDPVRGAELLCRYPRQSEPQPCYLSLDCETQRIWCTYDAEIGNAVPTHVWHRRTLRWSIPPLTAEAANDLMERVRPLAAQIVAGYEAVWDGSNHVGRYTADAEAAIEQIERICDGPWDETDVIESWDTEDWLSGIGNREDIRQ